MYFMVYDNWPTNYLFIFVKVKNCKIVLIPDHKTDSVYRTFYGGGWVVSTSFEHVGLGARNVLLTMQLHIISHPLIIVIPSHVLYAQWLSEGE